MVAGKHTLKGTDIFSFQHLGKVPKLCTDVLVGVADWKEVPTYLHVEKKLS